MDKNKSKELQAVTKTYEFRAWDKKWEKMYDNSHIYMYQGEMELQRTFENGDSAESVGLPDSDIILMEYTNKLDKLNNKIFSGDILRVKADFGFKKDIVGEVIWIGECYILRENGLRISDWCREHAMVIGNIHADPNVMEETKERIEKEFKTKKETSNNFKL